MQSLFMILLPQQQTTLAYILPSKVLIAAASVPPSDSCVNSVGNHPLFLTTICSPTTDLNDGRIDRANFLSQNGIIGYLLLKTT
jgi:hypothetical protein